MPGIIENFYLIILVASYAAIFALNLFVWLIRGTWVPFFVHCIAVGGAVVTLLVILSIPSEEPYTTIEFLQRIFTLPAIVYGVYVFFSGPLITWEDDDNNQDE
jgi:hypothetical protein